MGSREIDTDRQAAHAACDLPATVRVPEGVLFRQVGGEAVLLELESGHYYGLDPVATSMWLLLSRRGRVETVLAELLDRYDVEPERLERDLTGFVIELVERRLLETDAP